MKNKRLKPQKILRQGRRGLNEGKEDAAEALAKAVADALGYSTKERDAFWRNADNGKIVADTDDDALDAIVDDTIKFLKTSQEFAALLRPIVEKHSKSG